MATFEIISTATTERDASTFNAQLEQHLANLGLEGVSIERRKPNPSTMDLGTILAIAASSPVLVEIVKAISVCLTKTPTARISVKTEKGEFLLENVSSRDLVRLSKAFAQLQ